MQLEQRPDASFRRPTTTIVVATCLRLPSFLHDFLSCFQFLLLLVLISSPTFDLSPPSSSRPQQLPSPRQHSPRRVRRRQNEYACVPCIRLSVCLFVRTSNLALECTRNAAKETRCSLENASRSIHPLPSVRLLPPASQTSRSLRFGSHFQFCNVRAVGSVCVIAIADPASELPGVRGGGTAAPLGGGGK